MQVVIIGSGNTATVFGKLVLQKGHQIVQVLGRNSLAVSKLATQLNAAAVNSYSEINLDADLYILAVSDNAITEVAQKIDLVNKTIVHTAGSVPKSVLNEVSDSYGVIWPLQTLRKEIEQKIPEIPLMIDGNNEETIKIITSFALSLSKNVKFADDMEREKTHLAAVIASNFTNHLFALTDDFCEKENLDFQMLIPLIVETADRMKYSMPADVQTGPAARTDIVTIEKHLQLLELHPYLKKLYLRMSNSIMQSHFKK